MATCLWVLPLCKPELLSGYTLVVATAQPDVCKLFYKEALLPTWLSCCQSLERGPLFLMLTISSRGRFAEGSFRAIAIERYMSVHVDRVDLHVG